MVSSEGKEKLAGGIMDALIRLDISPRFRLRSLDEAINALTNVGSDIETSEFGELRCVSIQYENESIRVFADVQLSICYWDRRVELLRQALRNRLECTALRAAGFPGRIDRPSLCNAIRARNNGQLSAELLGYDTVEMLAHSQVSPGEYVASLTLSH